MLGSLAFLISGNMAIAASSQGGAMVPVDQHRSEAPVAATPLTVRVLCAARHGPRSSRPARRTLHSCRTFF
jgi:hypothetical protein